MAQLARDGSQSIAVLDKPPVGVFRVIFCLERARITHVRHKALDDGENGGRAPVPCTRWGLEDRGTMSSITMYRKPPSDVG